MAYSVFCCFESSMLPAGLVLVLVVFVSRLEPRSRVDASPACPVLLIVPSFFSWIAFAAYVLIKCFIAGVDTRIHFRK